MSSRSRRSAAPSSGVHLLSSHRVIAALVTAAGLGPTDLVIDFGAGPGTLTAPLARTGARVLAVERDPRFVAALRRRFDDHPRVRVIHDDVRTVRLPRRPFAVVANIPFAVTTPLLRRLLTPAASGFSRAELVVEWGLAKRLTAAGPRDAESAWWSCRFELTMRRQIPAGCFTPAPGVDAAHLGVRRRSEVDRRVSAILWALLSAAHQRAGTPARTSLQGVTPRRITQRLLGDRTAREITTETWLAMAKTLAADRNVVTPRLPS
jgi:23S rRNA (adenine-N6)-dimethyltransferase